MSSVDVNGARLYYERHGRGEPLLLTSMPELATDAAGPLCALGLGSAHVYGLSMFALERPEESYAALAEWLDRHPGIAAGRRRAGGAVHPGARAADRRGPNRREPRRVRHRPNQEERPCGG